MRNRPSSLTAALAALLCASTIETATASCGLCAREVHLTPALARCLVERYATLATRDDGAIAIDLSECEQDRGIIEPLPGPSGRVAVEPDLRFMLSRPQLDCLKSRIEEPGTVRLPLTRIDLSECR